MGCGKSKSKQDVASGNTVVTIRKNSSNNNAEEAKKISKDVETIQEKPTTTSEEINENVNQDDDHHETESGQRVQVAAAPEVKEISENTGLLDSQEDEAVESTVVINRNEEIEGNGVAVAVVEEEAVESAGERLISRDSPIHYFSSRKDEDAVGSVVSEISSEYDYPRHDNVKDEGPVLKESEKAGEVAVDVKETETNGQPATINEDNLISEGEAATTLVVDPETSTAAVGEKDVKVGEEILTESSQPKI